jgi:hypothetical protein
MMADNKEKRVRVKFCFFVRDCSEPDCGDILPQSGSEQSLTENKTSRTLFVLYNQPP